MTAKERLDFLLCSDYIRKVDRGELTPLNLDKLIDNQKKEIRELEHIRLLNMSEIVGLRRQIELLAEGE